MRTLNRLVSALQLALIGPSALFLTAVLVAAGNPPQYELAHKAQRLINWYSGRPWTLPLLLLALPLTVLVVGCATLLRSWNGAVEPPPTPPQSLATIPAPLATLLIAWATLTSAGILAIVVLHMLAN